MHNEPNELSLSELLKILGRSWMSIALLIVIATAGAAAIAFLMRPIYRGEILLSAATGQTGTSALSRLAEQFAPIAGIAAGNTDSSGGLSNKEVALATLSSRWLTESFIRERGLLPVLFANRWDQGAQQWKRKDGKPWLPTMDDAVRLFNKVRTVKEDRRTGLVTLAIEWRDRNDAADWANDLIARTNEFLRKRAIDEARRSITFLEGELSKTSVVERQQIIFRLIEQKTSDIMMANARKEYAFLIVDPAVAAEAHNFVRPNRLVIMAMGALAGLVIGILYVGMRWNLRGPERPQPAFATATTASRPGS